MSTKNSDSPKATLTLASLDVQADVDAFTFGIKSKIISFPNPGDMPWDEAQEFMEGMESANASQLLKLWLSEEDHKILMDGKLSLRQMNALLEAVVDHYQSIFGTPTVTE